MNKIRKGLISGHTAFVYEDICRDRMWELNVLRDLDRKANSVEWRRNTHRVWYVLFSASGFTEELKEIAAGREDFLLFDEQNS